MYALSAFSPRGFFADRPVQCFFCKQKLSSQCEMTNSNTMTKAMYGGRTAGIFGYSHLTGGFAGGQAEYVRVPFGDVNLLAIPDDVPDEKGKPTVFPLQQRCIRRGPNTDSHQPCTSPTSSPRPTTQSKTPPSIPTTKSPSSASVPSGRWLLRMRWTRVLARSSLSTRSHD